MTGRYGESTIAGISRFARFCCNATIAWGPCLAGAPAIAPAITQASGIRHDVVSISPLAAGILCPGLRNAEESRHEHAIQNDAGYGRLYLDPVDCRERLRTGAALNV
jgi:hypothetical protein